MFHPKMFMTIDMQSNLKADLNHIMNSSPQCEEMNEKMTATPSQPPIHLDPQVDKSQTLPQQPLPSHQTQIGRVMVVMRNLNKMHLMTTTPSFARPGISDLPLMM